MKEIGDNFKDLGFLDNYLSDKLNENKSVLNIPQNIINSYVERPSGSRIDDMINNIDSTALRNFFSSVLNDIIADDDLFLINTSSSSSYPKNSILSMIDFNRDINFHDEFRTGSREDPNDNSTYHVIPNRDAPIRFIYNILSETDKGLDVTASAISGGNGRLKYFKVVRYTNKDFINLHTLNSKLEDISESISDMELKISKLKESHDNYDFIKQYMINNNIKTESILMLKSRMILSNLKDEDSDKDDPSILTSISDILDLDL